MDTREKGIAILEGAKASGEICPDVDVSLCLDMILGTIVLRLLVAHTTLGDNLADEMISLVLEGARSGASHN